jgi:haloalkane dehalogenase
LIPAWVDRREYPFEPRTLDVDGARLSYLDEGEGAPIVMVHGAWLRFSSGRGGEG